MHSSPKAPSSRGTPARPGRPPKVATSPAQYGSTQLPSEGSNKSAPTFYSCLSIPVQGAKPINSDSSSAEPASNQQDPATPSTAKRAPRKSKTEALAALNTHSRSNSVEVDDSEPPDILAQKYRNVPPISVPPALDLSCVRTARLRDYQPPSHTSRLFGLQNCPEYRPTTEQFKDPMAYIRSISPEAKKFGMCKIIPPEGWDMPFVTDTESFRFNTRLQRLNSIEASSRAKLNFLEQLYRFHSQQGNLRVVVPTINHKPLDLWLLRKEVHNLGGYDAVTKAKMWSDLGRRLGYGGVPGLSTQIRNSYAKVILPYEQFCERARNTPLASVNGSVKPVSSVGGERSPSRLDTAMLVDDDDDSKSPTSSSSSPLSEVPDEGETKDGTKRGRKSMKSPEVAKTKASSSGPAINPPAFVDKPGKGTTDQHCEICSKMNRGEEMLLCDGCDCGFHMFCLEPPLDTIPKDQWFCYTCLSGTGGDFGFDEGEEHSLASFQARDREFRKYWFQTHKPQSAEDDMVTDDPTHNHFDGVTVSEHDVENEFWRLVQSQSETVEIEYGADVHSTTHGSGMPSMETHPLNEYSKDPWNLNNIPIVPDSLLRFIKSDISGMTVPWTYVGMTFSTFCWHNEDHYTYSINFMHWGETKTWYGIPGSDAEKFEAAMKCEAPELFEAQPDLLFQLVTLMNPQRVKDAGVDVYACNQRAGDLVITFPKAYHAGFNHGLNFNEAVNFAFDDWLPYGRDCVQRYREHRKPPVFSHDELLITITQQSQTIKTALCIIDSLKEMIDREQKDRQAALALGISEVLEQEDRPEEQYQCAVCKAFCYLSQITCSCTTKVVCVEHADLLCERPRSHLTLRKRFSDDELAELLAKVTERANIPNSWQNKYTKSLSDMRPSLRSLRALLAEGERINYPLRGLTGLRRFVARANEWVDSANSFTIRKQSRKRVKRGRGRPSLASQQAQQAEQAMEDVPERPDRTIEELYLLLKEVDALGFDCPEIDQLRALARSAERMKEKAANLLKLSDSHRDRDDFISQCRSLLIDGSSLNVQIDELSEVEKIVDREQLILDLEEKLDGTLTLQDVRQLIDRCRACYLSPDNEHFCSLENKLSSGEEWDSRAKAVLSKQVKTIEELDEFADVDPDIPLDPTLLDRLSSARAKAKDFEKQANAWLHPDASSTRPRAQDVLRLVSRAEKDYNLGTIQQLKDLANFAIDIESRAEHALKLRYRFDSVEEKGSDSFSVMQKWLQYASENLSIFSIPALRKLEDQLDAHTKWIRSLPWWNDEEERSEGAEVLRDVLASTNQEDDHPPHDVYVTCICDRPVYPPPPGQPSDAVQCDHCFARFHGDCATNGGSCPFCDHHHWNGEISKKRHWHFCFLPRHLETAPEISRHYSQEYKNLQVIVHRVDRLVSVIGQFLTLTSQAPNQHPDYIMHVRHYMRKLYRLQFPVSPNPDVSFGLDLAGLHRILAARPPAARPKKKRRPRLTFGQDVDSDWTDGTRCICRGRTPYLLNYRTVSCESCLTRYHATCVFYPPTEARPFLCPLCCLRRGKSYAYAEVRVTRMTDNELPPGTYVDTKYMLENYSRNIIYKTLGPLYTHTLFVDLVKYAPGSDGDSDAADAYSPDGHSAPRPPSPRVPRAPSPAGSPRPPSTHSAVWPSASWNWPGGHDSSSVNRKRRADDGFDDGRMTDSPKRRALASQSPRAPPVPPSPNYHPSPHPSLSPSLAMIMSAPPPQAQATPRMQHAIGPPSSARHHTLPPIRTDNSPYARTSPPMRAMSPIRHARLSPLIRPMIPDMPLPDPPRIDSARVDPGAPLPPVRSIQEIEAEFEYRRLPPRPPIPEMPLPDPSRINLARSDPGAPLPPVRSLQEIEAEFEYRGLPPLPPSRP